MGKCSSKSKAKYVAKKPPKEAKPASSSERSPKLEIKGDEEVQTYTKEITKKPKSNSIDITLSKVTTQGVQNLIQSLDSLKDPIYVSLCFHECEQMVDEDVISFFTKLNSLNLAGLKEFKLEFSWAYNVKVESFLYLQDCIDSAKALENFSFKIGGFQIDNSLLQSILKGLQTKKSLRCLTLQFDQCVDIQDQSIFDLQTLLTKHINSTIEQVSLDFRGCELLDDEVLNPLLNDFCQLSNLSKLTLDFTKCDNFREEKAWEYLTSLQRLATFEYYSNKTIIIKSTNFKEIQRFQESKSSSKLPSTIEQSPFVQNIQIDLSHDDDVHDESIEFICDMLEKFQDLAVLILNLKNSRKITNSSIGKLPSVLKELGELKIFYLNIEDCKQLTDDILAELSSAFKGNLIEFCTCVGLITKGTQITEFGTDKFKDNLRFANGKSLTTAQVHQFYEGLTSLNFWIGSFPELKKFQNLDLLSRDFKSLSDIYIDFDPNQEFIKEQDTKEMISYFKNLTQIKSLYIDLFDCRLLSDGAITSFEEMIEGMVELQAFYLNITNCEWLSNVGLISVFSSLKTLDGIQNLGFNSKNCEKIGDKALLVLSELIFKQRDLLYKLQVNMSSCFTLTNVALERFLASVKTTKVLREANINFARCDLVKKGLKEKFEEGLGFVRDKKIVI